MLSGWADKIDSEQDTARFLESDKTFKKALKYESH